MERLLSPCACAQLLGGLPSNLFVHDSHPSHNIQLLFAGLPLPLRFPSDSWLDCCQHLSSVQEERTDHGTQHNHLPTTGIWTTLIYLTGKKWAPQIPTQCPWEHAHRILKPTEGRRVPADADNWGKPFHFRGQTSSFTGLRTPSASCLHTCPLHGIRPFPPTYCQMSPDHSGCSLDGVPGVFPSCPRWN